LVAKPVVGSTSIPPAPSGFLHMLTPLQNLSAANAFAHPLRFNVIARLELPR
jgi:hypothetical protein